MHVRVPVEVAAARIMGDPTRKGERYTSIDQAIADIRARKASENERFLLKYTADCGNMANFDYVADTDNQSPQEVADGILDAYLLWKRQIVS